MPRDRDTSGGFPTRAPRPGRVLGYVTVVAVAALGGVLVACPDTASTGGDGKGGPSASSIGAATQPLKSDIHQLELGLASRDDQIRALEQALAERDAVLARHQQALEEIEGRLGAQAGDVSAIRAILEGVGGAGEGGDDEVGPPGLVDSVRRLEQGLAALEEARAQLAAGLEHSRTALQNLAVRSSDEAATVDARLSRLTREVETLDQNLESIVEALRKHSEIVNVNQQVPEIEGLILAVEQRPDGPLLLLSVGAGEEVKRGYEFKVRRGERILAKLLIVEVNEAFASARIIKTIEGAVRVGDQVTTRS